MDNDNLRQMAIQFAKDFDIKYETIKIRQKGSHVTFSTSGESSGGWQESGRSESIQKHIIKRYSEIREKMEKFNG